MKVTVPNNVSCMKEWLRSDFPKPEHWMANAVGIQWGVCDGVVHVVSERDSPLVDGAESTDGR